MKVKLYGTRGSSPVSDPAKAGYGGNTTCLRVESQCLPEGMWLIVDAGTGIVPLSGEFAQQGGKEATILFTHWHHDHTQGFALSTLPYMKHVPVRLVGPREHGIGPHEVFKTLIRSPLFPLNLEEVGSHIKYAGIEFPNVNVILIHPQGGFKMLDVETYERLLAGGRQLTFDRGKRFDLAECMLISMHKNNHPEFAISYRFQEMTTGRTFVFLTDHENQDGISATFRKHLAAPHLLVMDAQYTRAKYDKQTTGWGHATPDYAAYVAYEVGAKKLGLTHHDPFSDDATVDSIVEAARDRIQLNGNGTEVFGCRDYMTVEV